MDPNESSSSSLSSTRASNQPPVGQWTTGLCDCFDDPANCFTTCCCPCITLGQVAEIVDRGRPSCLFSGLVYFEAHGICAGWLFSRTYRTKLRELFSLPETPCGDLMVHGCCDPCAICQEYRELKNRGADPSIGWEANVNEWKQAGLAAPLIQPNMLR